mgnify:CR=1 FL=1
MPELRLRRLTVARLVAAVAIGLAVGLVDAVECRADSSCDCGPCPREQDQVWLVSSRGLWGCDWESNVTRLKVSRYDRTEKWVASDLQSFLNTDDADTVTVVFLHGNRIDSCTAYQTGWSAYRRLTSCAAAQPVRFVIWSWPSSRECGPIRDARIKAARTDAHGYYLAWFVDQMQGDVPVSFWGHSFGARIATGALHLLGGGALAGHRLERRDPGALRPMQAALLASALDSDWLLPGHRHGDAWPQLEGLLLVNNRCDRLLQRYHLLYCRRSCRRALGATGVSTRRLPADQAAKVYQIDACCYVGKQHRLVNYLCSPTLMAHIRAHLLFEEKTATMDPAEAEAQPDKPLAEAPTRAEPSESDVVVDGPAATPVADSAAAPILEPASQ